MPRRPNLRETNIYWLFDTVTNVPLYCGKTVALPLERLAQHLQTSIRCPDRDVSKAIRNVGSANIRIEVVEIVPLSVNWAERERHWISILRRQNPLAVNATDGGQGAPGRIHSPETLMKISVANRGKKEAPEATAKRIARLKGRKLSPDHVAKLVGLTHSHETRAKMRAARDQHNGGTRPGQTRSDIERAKMSAGWAKRRAEGKKRAPVSPEVRANMAEAQRVAWIARRRSVRDMHAV